MHYRTPLQRKKDGIPVSNSNNRKGILNCLWSDPGKLISGYVNSWHNWIIFLSTKISPWWCASFTEIKGFLKILISCFFNCLFPKISENCINIFMSNLLILNNHLVGFFCYYHHSLFFLLFLFYQILHDLSVPYFC